MVETYRKLLYAALRLPANQIRVIGRSELGKNIYALHFGEYKNNVLISCSIHAREYITTCLLNNLLKEYKYNFGIWYIPIANPDGVKMCIENKLCKTNRWLQTKHGFSDFSLWKANANGVDLNVNFDSDWSKGSENVKQISYANYIGFCPESESETIVLANFAKEINPLLNLCFHSKGEVVYYGHKIDEAKKKKAENFCKLLAKNLKYTAIKTKKSFGGFADYTSNKLGVISATIEIGSDHLLHPIKESELPKIASHFSYFFSFLNDYIISY